ncbi:G-protein coupled receptor [Biomphalaria glabrata]|nr:putative G-protein coupled receptor [Biomphalaria glabrata]
MNDSTFISDNILPTNYSDLFYTTRVVKSSLATVKPLLTAEDEREFFLLKCFVSPCLSGASLVLNILSLVIFVKSGLHKPTNIFLFALSFADTMSQALNLNFAQILRYFGPGKPFPYIITWQYPYTISYVLFVCEMLWNFVGYWGMYVQSSIPVLISAERILAVFWPLKFRQWVTCKSASVVVTLAYVFWLPWIITFQNNYTFWFLEIQHYYFGTRADSRFLRDNLSLIVFFNVKFFQNLSSWVPVTLVLAGCVAIAVKVKLTLKKRQHLTASWDSKHWSMKTTRALTSVCLCFAITHTIYCVVVNLYIQEIENITFKSNLVGEYLRVILSANKICNFVVYVWFNDKFQKCLKEILKIEIKHFGAA